MIKQNKVILFFLRELGNEFAAEDGEGFVFDVMAHGAHEFQDKV